MEQLFFDPRDTQWKIRPGEVSEVLITEGFECDQKNWDVGGNRGPLEVWGRAVMLSTHCGEDLASPGSIPTSSGASVITAEVTPPPCSAPQPCRGDKSCPLFPRALNGYGGLQSCPGHASRKTGRRKEDQRKEGKSQIHEDLGKTE